MRKPRIKTDYYYEFYYPGVPCCNCPPKAPKNDRSWGAAGESHDPLVFSEIAGTWESNDASGRLFGVGDGLSGVWTARGTLFGMGNRLAKSYPASDFVTMGEQLIFRNFAYLRCRDKSIVGRGDLVAFVIRDSDLGTSATRHLNGQQTSVKDVEGQWHYGG